MNDWKKKLIGDRKFYRRLFAIAVPMMIQMGITNFASMLDNIMVGQMGTEQMTGVAIANQLIFVYNICTLSCCVLFHLRSSRFTPGR